MIEMDRFVHSLKGEEIEIIERTSIQSAATMKEQGTTIQEYRYICWNSPYIISLLDSWQKLGKEKAQVLGVAFLTICCCQGLNY